MTPTIAFFTIALLVLPQWFLMIVKPNSKWTQQLVDSDIIPFCLLFIFVMAMAPLEETPLTFHSSADLFAVFGLQEIALGAWAFIGFLSLLVSTWIFNKLKNGINDSSKLDHLLDGRHPPQLLSNPAKTPLSKTLAPSLKSPVP